jgi:hypothetical protein
MENERHMNTFIKRVEKNKAASKVCKQFFAEHMNTHLHGDLQRIALECWEHGGDDDAIRRAGTWWLWMRELAIDNTFSKPARIVVMKNAARAASLGEPIHFVSARSPELLHAQVKGQGDKELPRSKKALNSLAEIVSRSKELLPTHLTVLFADLAIDNLDNIAKACDVEETIKTNIEMLVQIAAELELTQFNVIRLSQLQNGDQPLSKFISPSGEVLISVDLNGKALNMIQTATNESAESHRIMFGWSPEQTRNHNEKLGITMGLVGQSVKQFRPCPILIHNEAFIARGALNNLFTDPQDPLPVICLRSLLETKRARG